MIKPPYDSLSLSLVMPFVALGFVVSALLSLITFALVANSEERTIERMLHVEMESFLNRMARNPAALPPSTTELSGHFLPIPDFQFIQTVEPGQERFERVLYGDRDFTIWLANLDGKPYALI